MNTPLNTCALLLALGLASGCQSNDKQETAASSSAQAQAQAPAPAAASAPTAAPTTGNVPAPLPLTAVDVRPAVEQLLPPQGYIEAISAKPLTIEPMAVALPPLWGSLKPGAARSRPGYRITYEAVVKWVPKGYGVGQKVPATMPLYTPNGADSLARFTLGGMNPIIPGQEKYTITEVAPNKPVTVRGVLYTFSGQDNQQQPALVVYPYRNRGGMPNANKMVYLPLAQ
jgi:hypothetical protein